MKNEVYIYMKQKAKRLTLTLNSVPSWILYRGYFLLISYRVVKRGTGQEIANQLGYIMKFSLGRRKL